MTKFILKLVLGVVLTVAALLAYGIYSYKGKAERYLEEIVSLSARQSGVNLAFEDFKLNLVGAEAKKLGIFFQRAFLNLNLNEPRIKVPILSAVMLSPEIKFSAKFYESNIGADARYSVNKKTTGGRLRVENLDLSKVQELKIFGVIGGILNINFDNLRISPEGPEYLEGQFALENFSTNTDRTFPAFINGQMQDFTLPKVSSLSSAANLLFEKGTLSIKDGNLKSDLGNAGYKGDFKYSPKGGLGTIAFQADIILSGKGLKYFGYLLPQISNNILDETQSRFTVKIDGNTRALKYSFFKS